MKTRTILISILTALTGLPLTAQISPPSPVKTQANVAGILYASNFGQWQVPKPNLGTWSWNSGTYCQVSESGSTFVPFVANTPVEIVDEDNAAWNESVTPSSVTILPQSCSIVVTPTRGHSHFHFASATAGLQEALNWAGTTAYQVLLTPDWTLLGGTTGMITAATGNANVTIEDQRLACQVAYLWGGSAYAAQPSSCSGGSSGTVNSGTANQLAYYQSTGTAVSGTNAIPNGTTATTQAANDNSTKLATTAYADRVAGSGVQYNPSNTQSIWIGASLLIVNGNPNLAASAVTCTSGSCVMSVTQTWASGIDVGFGGGFSPSCLTDQVFPMTSRTGSTVTVSAPACSTTTGTGGNVWDASNSWPEQTQLQPFFNGHGTTLNLGVGAQTVATENSSYTSLYHTQIAACVATGAKCFVYLISGVANDLAASSSALSASETNYLQLAAKIHAEGSNVIVVGVTTPPSLLNGSGNSFLAQANIDAFNSWLTAQNVKGAATTGQGWDDIVDVATYARDNGSNNYNSDHIHFSNAGTVHAADLTNSQMASQSSMPSGALPGLAGTNYFTGSQVLYDSTNLTSLGWYQFISGGNTYFYQGTSSSAGNGYLMIHPQASNHYLVLPGANVGLGANSSTIGCGPVCTDPDTGMSRGAAGQFNFGAGGSIGDETGGAGMTWLHTPLNAAPSGSCTSGQANQWRFAGNGTLTYCPTGGGTWTAFTSGGTTTNPLTMNNSGSGAASGSTFDGSAARTISYNTIGAAPLASPTFTGTPAAPTATGGTNTTQLATTAFVQAAIAAAGTGAGIVTYSGPSLAFTGTQYFPIGGGATSSTTETNVDIDSPAAVTIQNMTVQMSAAPGVGATIVFTWRKNASSQVLTCTITGAVATSCSDTTHSFTTAALDLLDIQAVTTGSVVGTPTVVMAAQVGVSATTTTAFSAISSGTNTAAAMTVGSGASLAPSGTGTVSANQINGTGVVHGLVQALVCADTSGSGTAQTCTTSPSYTPATGDFIIYTTTTANSGTGLTVNVNSLGAKSVAKWQTTTTLAANDVRANTQIIMVYDGTNWEMGPIGNAPSSGSSGALTNLCAAGGLSFTNATCSGGIISVSANVNTFTISGLPSSGYNNLLIRANFGTGAAATNSIKGIRFNGDTGNNYTFVGLNTTGNVAGANSQSSMQICRNPNADVASCNVVVSAFLGSQNKGTTTNGGYYDGTTFQAFSMWGEWKSGSAVSSVTFFNTSGDGNMNGSTVTIFGEN